MGILYKYNGDEHRDAVLCINAIGHSYMTIKFVSLFVGKEYNDFFTTRWLLENLLCYTKYE